MILKWGIVITKYGFKMMDRFKLEDTVTIAEINVRVAVITQMIYPGNPEKQAYETMVFSLEDYRSIARVQESYKTEAEAQQGHESVVARLKTGQYKVIPVKWVIEFEDVEPKGEIGSRWKGKRRRDK